MRRALIVLLPALMVLGLGCTKRVPYEEPTFDARQTVVLTFQDGTQVTGKIGAIGEGVEVVSGGVVYRGEVSELTRNEIIISDCRFVRREGHFSAAQDRLESARVDLGVPPTEFRLPIDGIAERQRITIDPMRTAARAAFWALTGTLSAFLLAERS